MPKITKKEFKRHFYEAGVSFPATLKAETLCSSLALALEDAKKLFVYCNITGNVDNIEKTWSGLDQRLGTLVALVHSVRRDISAAIATAAGGRTQAQQPKRPAK